jgi:PKD repeat protein
MIRRPSIASIASIMVLILLAATATADVVKKGNSRRLGTIEPVQLRENTRLAAADTCFAVAFDSMAWAIDGWLMGDELYKALLDPSANCDNPYPYTVEEIHMMVGFEGATYITYAGDVEAVDYTNPNCPMPGALLGMSPDYQDWVPIPDFYDIWVVLDPPVVVNGPFFAGFYFGPGIDPYSVPLIVTDDTPVLCNSFNMWDESVGWVDMVDNSLYNFPGRLAMYAVGSTGGGTTAPPVAEFSATPTVACPGNTITFTSLSSGTIATYNWSFGDGATSTSAGPTHAYATPGPYSVSLTVNGPGGSNTESKTNYVTIPAVPTSGFVASPVSGAAPLYVNFSNQATGGTSWLWNFGDGTTSTLQQPSHNYTTAGIYTVSLTASTYCGSDLETKTAYITVQNTTTEPAPEVAWLSVDHGHTLKGSSELWVNETTGSEHVDYVVFEYSSGGGYIPIGTDFDGASPLRDGSSAAAIGSGFSLVWDFSHLPEGTYTLRATAHDTLGQTGSAIATVYLEPTPPIATITSPDNGNGFCDQLRLLMSCYDENMGYVEIHRRPASSDYSAGLTTTTATARNCAPAAAALAARLWADRGIPVMQYGGGTLTVPQLTDSLAARCDSDDNLGTYDDDLFWGIKKYFADHGNLLDFAYQRTPGYYDLRVSVEEQQQSTIIGLSGASGRWLAVDGFGNWPSDGEDWLVTVSDPTTGTSYDLSLRDNFTNHQILYNGSWHNVDIMITMFARNYPVARQLMGADFNSADGWSYTWEPTGLIDNSLYYFRSTGYDAGGLSGVSTVLLQYSCANQLVPGDYNDDKAANILDLVLLVDFVTGRGPAPSGGTTRADANGDGYVNIADVVYYMNYLFGSAEAPTF